MYKVLTIAGSDSGGGAGMQADLKTFQSFGVHGVCAITAVTAQNTVGVSDVFELPASFVATQIDTVMEDIGADAWKTGMLANGDIVGVVADLAKRYKVKRLVVDPVMTAGTGRRLLRKDAEEAFIQKLLPLATIVTPNIPEAEVLTGIKIKSIGDMKKAAIIMRKMGVKNVVIKGGHSHPFVIARSEATWQSDGEDRHANARDDVKKDPHGLRPQDDMVGEVVDILYNGKKFHEFKAPWIDTQNTHGTGCIFASAVAAQLAEGNNIEEAVSGAKKYVAELLKRSRKVKIGEGNGPLV